MNTTLLRIFFLMMLSVMAFTVALGQGFSNVGSASANFLKIPVEPVGASLAGSIVATSRGADGMYWNPGALAFTEGTEVLVSRVNWILDTRLSHLGIAHQIGDGALGISVTALTMEEMEITTETQPNGTSAFFNAGSYAFGLSYGVKIIDRFSFGGTAKYVYEYIWETHGSTFAFDFGSVYVTDFHNLRIGMRLVNFGGNMTFRGTPIDEKPSVIAQSGISYSYDPRLDRIAPEYPLPQLFNVGISMDVLADEGHVLTMSSAVTDANDNVAQLGFGVEYCWNNMISVRAGYKSGYDDQDLSAGLGFRTEIEGIRTQLDFAYASFERLGETTFLALRIGI